MQNNLIIPHFLLVSITRVQGMEIETVEFLSTNSRFKCRLQFCWLQKISFPPIKETGYSYLRLPFISEKLRDLSLSYNNVYLRFFNIEASIAMCPDLCGTSRFSEVPRPVPLNHWAGNQNFRKSFSWFTIFLKFLLVPCYYILVCIEWNLMQ